VWAHYATSLIQVLGTPVVAITIIMVFVERAFGFGIFDPARGGDPVLFQHLFWFYSHPAVYIMILPAMGVISELVSTFSRKKIFGYSFVAFSSWRSPCSASSCGRTTCSSPASRPTRRWCSRS
jgi:cytochrome c oxidase subunit I